MSPFVRKVLVRSLHVGSMAIVPLSRLIGAQRIFYRDIVRCGGPGPALQRALREIGSTLPVAKGPEGLPGWIDITSGSRSVDMLMRADERLFTFQVWGKGVRLARGSTPFLIEVARAVDRWIGSSCTARELAASFPFVTADGDAHIYESGDPVEYRWQCLLSEEFRRHDPHFADIVLTTSMRPQLRRLFPFISMFYLKFSRCTGFPYTYDLPFVSWRGDHGYVVFNFDHQRLGKRATAEEAADLLVLHLPADCGRAVAGTAGWAPCCLDGGRLEMPPGGAGGDWTIQTVCLPRRTDGYRGDGVERTSGLGTG